MSILGFAWSRFDGILSRNVLWGERRCSLWYTMVQRARALSTNRLYPMHPASFFVFSILRLEFIKENKKVRKKEKKNSTKKAILVFFFSWLLSWSSSFFLFFSCFLTFLFFLWIPKWILRGFRGSKKKMKTVRNLGSGKCDFFCFFSWSSCPS